MSSERREEGKEVITLDEAMQQLNLLEEQIKKLQNIVADLETRITRMSSIESILVELKEGSDNVLIPLDQAFSVVVKGSIKPIERAIVHVGLNIFVEVDREKAIEIIRKERMSASKLLEMYSRELSKVTQYYSALRSAVEQALTAQR